MLAALLQHYPELAQLVERLIFLDPNLRTEVFEGEALLAEFVEGFRALGLEAAYGGLPAAISEASLREQQPAVYREWCLYRLQHGCLNGQTFFDRASALAGLDLPLALIFSQDTDEAELAALPRPDQWLVQRLAGDHSGFMQQLEPGFWPDSPGETKQLNKPMSAAK